MNSLILFSNTGKANIRHVLKVLFILSAKLIIFNTLCKGRIFTNLKLIDVNYADD